MALRWSDYIASGFGQSKTPGTQTPDNNSQTYKWMPLHTDRNKINHACISASNVRPIEDENSVKPAFKSALRQSSLTPRHIPKRNEFISRREILCSSKTITLLLDTALFMNLSNTRTNRGVMNKDMPWISCATIRKKQTNIQWLSQNRSYLWWEQQLGRLPEKFLGC